MRPAFSAPLWPSHERLTVFSVTVESRRVQMSGRRSVEHGVRPGGSLAKTPWWWLVLVCVVFTVVILGICSSFANAWNESGHEAIGMTAMSAINPAALAQLKRLLGGKDIVDVSGWAHKVNRKHPGTIPLHFQLQKTFSRDNVDLSQCPDGQCLVTAIKHFYARLAGAGLGIPELKYPGNLKFTDVDAFKYLINLLGDLHQPMHFGPVRDNSGRDLYGTYADEGEKKRTSLYELWDQNIIQKLIRDRSHFWNGGWTHVSFLRRGLASAEKDAWESASLANRTAIIDQWAEESATLAFSACYKGDSIKEGFEMGQEEALQSFEFVRTRLLLAGLRTSLVVNSLLEQKEVSKLRQGSGVAISDESSLKRKRGGAATAGRHWVRNLLLNLSIVSVVLLALLYMTRYFSSTQTSYGNIAHSARTTSKEMVEKAS